MVYYDTVGYFPESMDDAVAFVQKTYWPDMKEEDLRAQQLLTDPLAKTRKNYNIFLFMTIVQNVLFLFSF